MLQFIYVNFSVRITSCSDAIMSIALICQLVMYVCNVTHIHMYTSLVHHSKHMQFWKCYPNHVPIFCSLPPSQPPPFKRYHFASPHQLCRTRGSCHIVARGSEKYEHFTNINTKLPPAKVSVRGGGERTRIRTLGWWPAWRRGGPAARPPSGTGRRTCWGQGLSCEPAGAPARQGAFWFVLILLFHLLFVLMLVLLPLLFLLIFVLLFLLLIPPLCYPEYRTLPEPSYTCTPAPLEVCPEKQSLSLAVLRIQIVLN